ncbi:MAG: hypothetical protein H6604_07815 [Flavobacteriales bacterium]|nr:hypothetical protein [Flavobacteriales bacterium]
METLSITAYAEDKNQITALKAFMKAMKIKFKITDGEKPYKSEFVEMIAQNQEDFKNGKFKKITLDEIWK